MAATAHGSIFFSILIALWTVATPGRAADVYVAFDAQGAAQFADRPLDSRYQLLFKDLRASGPVVGAATGTGVPAWLREQLQQAATRHGLDYALLEAVVRTESGFNADAVSPKGAIGLMQLMPDTAMRYGVAGADPTTLAEWLRLPAINIEAGSRHLSELLRRYDGDTTLALAAYNAGEAAVRRAGNRVPDYPETRHYVRKVMNSLGTTTATVAASAAGPRPAATASAARVQQVSAHRPQRAGADTVQVYRGEHSEIERFERGFVNTAAGSP